MSQTNLVTAADYADSLITARRIKNVLFVGLLLTLFIQLTLFAIARYTTSLPTPLHAPNTHSTGVAPASDSKAVTERNVLQYLIGLLDFAGIILPPLFAISLFIILQVQLVGRLVGTGRLTSALIWSGLLVLLLFPWQAVLNNPAISYDKVANEFGMKVPGALYTWAEFSDPDMGARFKGDEFNEKAVLHWARYAAFPLASVLLLMVIEFKSERGVKQSLGLNVPIIESTDVNEPVV